MASRTLLAGTVAVPLKPLIKLLNCSAGSKAEIAASTTHTAIVIDGDGIAPRRFTFAVPEVHGDVPDRPPIDTDAVTVEIASGSLAVLCDRTGFVAARKSAGTRWATDGVELRVGDGRVSASATDCFRLATATAPAVVPAKQKAKFLIAEAVLRSWLRPIRDTESVRLSFGQKVLVLRAGNFAAWAPALDGTFPEPASVPSELPHALTVPGEPFRAAVESALALVDGSGEPQITLTTKRNALLVSSAIGRARCESTVPAPGNSDPSLTVGVDGHRLLGALRAYRDGPTITLSYASPDTPIAVAIPDARTLLVPHRPREEKPARASKGSA